MMKIRQVIATAPEHAQYFGHPPLPVAELVETSLLWIAPMEADSGPIKESPFTRTFPIKSQATPWAMV